MKDWKRDSCKGRFGGKMKGKIEILYFDMQMTIPEIADKLSISEEQVQDIVENLKRTAEM